MYEHFHSRNVKTYNSTELIFCEQVILLETHLSECIFFIKKDGKQADVQLDGKQTTDYGYGYLQH